MEDIIMTVLIAFLVIVALVLVVAQIYFSIEDENGIQKHDIDDYADYDEDGIPYDKNYNPKKYRR